MNRQEAGNYPQACASCKHQRKKCDENCELAPYFPASRFLEFQNAHRLFGVSNIQRIIGSVDPHQRQEAANSILIESTLRSNDPVNGSLGVIRNLESQIELNEKELEIVNQWLVLFRQNDGKMSGNFPSVSSLLALPDLEQNRYDGLAYDLPMNDVKVLTSYDQPEDVLGFEGQMGESSSGNKDQGKQQEKLVEVKLETEGDDDDRDSSTSLNQSEMGPKK